MTGPRESINAFGTVLERFVRNKIVEGKPPHPHEHKLLEHVLQAGLSGGDFYVAKKMAAMSSLPGFTMTCLLLCERLAFGEGSTFLDLEPDRLAARLEVLGLSETSLGETLANIQETLLAERVLISDSPEERRAVPFFLDRENNGLFRQAQYRAEQRVAEGLRRRITQTRQPDPGLNAVFASVTELFPLGTHPWQPGEGAPWLPIRLAPEQKLATLAALRSYLTIITGGPGTGKTSIVITILRLLAGLGVSLHRVVLAAPTGRAANRMAESIRAGLESIQPEGRHPAFQEWDSEPQTLHRLLGYSPVRGRFTHDHDNPIEADWLIVDECSMADLLLMECLFDALQTKTSIILLGDANQLPSVDAGAVFKDMAEAAGVPAPVPEDPWRGLELLKKRTGTLAAHVISLKRSFRQRSDGGGGHILEIAARIQRQEAEALFDGKHGRPIRMLDRDSPWPWEGVCLISPDQMSIRALAAQLFQRFLQEYQRLSTRGFTSFQQRGADLARLFDHLQRLRILCLTRASALGVDHLNQLFRQRFFCGDRWFYAGVPWMVTRNDYRRRLFNGDIGIALWLSGTRGERQRWLVFQEAAGFKPVPFDSLGALEPAFAMTVHKSQGSEMDHVVLILPEKSHHLCKKEVIYTALTRAKRSVLIYGRPEMLVEAAMHGTDRATGLKRILKTPQEPETPDS